MIPRWPDKAPLQCGCQVSLKKEGPLDVVMYFPCESNCPTLHLTKQECEKVGKRWEKRHASSN